ncbi:PREDICTED: uncharacterized protein LOC109592806 isoform X2 [Amphimedon queenslandica]|uniref:Uncharacterized protein n=1 Tax=Amphimedon queenslandica TaxID=400682 RepID=A0AAN0K3N5_AMPQE|nr:PREDICTED: uncharacterized protein LOC109592806 isoform X2 [Amphimedon queenslandica]|eukprot:XP_019863783.1 PREDICTED: uncharacterized protein LOC109592806 isoform X2 [Amphimedon queenslandica]
MAEGRGSTQTVKGKRYQELSSSEKKSDRGESSDGSRCSTQNAVSISGKYVKSITTPNENRMEDDDNDQEQNDEHVPAPATRSNIVRLEENEEYPIKRHCFRDCTKTIFRNQKRCAIVPFVLAFVFMVIFIVCILRITEMYLYYHFGDGDNNTKELFIPAGSVVDVNLTSLNINAKHINKLKVTVPDKSSPVRVTTAQEDHQISLPFNINITLNYETGRYRAITRYWKSREHITGDITFLGFERPRYLRNCYKWGNITNPPYCTCDDGSGSINKTFNISACFSDDDRGNDKHIIYIRFCLVESDDANIVINITETYVIPNKMSYKSIHNDDTDNQNSAVLQFPSLLSELCNPSKLYVNTHYKNTNDDCSEMIKLELKPDAMEIMETVALVITAILSLLLSLMMFGIGIRCCCCCHIKTGFCALGLFYEEPERQVRQPLCQSDGSSSEGGYGSIREETPEDLLRNSWSPEGTPVSSITAPNENNEEEENAIQQDAIL